jgi:hypothetical protein
VVVLTKEEREESEFEVALIVGPGITPEMRGLKTSAVNAI